MSRLLIAIFLLTACSQAGVLPDSPSTSTSLGENSTGLIKINGRVGIGEPVTQADVTAVIVTVPDIPQILAESQSDDSGEFIFENLPVTSEDSLMLIASGGKYVDPITFKTIALKSDSLSGVWKVRHIALLESVDVTPFTTLHSAFYECLIGNPALQSDPVDYSHAVFKSVFGVDLNAETDAYLTGESNSPAGSGILSRYNLAFSALSEWKNAASALQITAAFEDSLRDDCDLLGPLNRVSGSYAFHSESFRKDYLDALESLNSRAAFTDLGGETEISEQIDSIRTNTGILFEYSSFNP